MEGGATFELVLRSSLVVVPVLSALSVFPRSCLRSLVEGTLHLLAAEDEALLCGWDAFLFLDALLDAGDLCGAWLVVCSLQKVSG